MIQSRLLLWSIVSALAGFLFGFDTVVISGAESTIQELWDLSPEMHGIAMGSALWGTVLGSLVGSWPTDRLGRKTTLLWIGILFIVGAIWSAIAQEVYSFMIARFLGGAGRYCISVRLATSVRSACVRGPSSPKPTASYLHAFSRLLRHTR